MAPVMLFMPRKRKPYVHREKTRHGNYAWYFRKGDGPRFRLHGEYESPDWLADYEAALAGQKRVVPPTQTGTLKWLVNAYYESVAFKTAALSTQGQRRHILNNVVKENGDRRLAEITSKKIAEGRDRRSATPAQAVVFVKAMRAMFKWALEAKHVTVNPCVGIIAVDPKTDGHHTWTMEEVEQFQKQHAIGSMPRLALDIMLYTGMRRSDAILFGRQHVKNGLINYRSVKTGVTVIAPVLASLGASIAAAGAQGRMTYLVSQFGGQFKSSNSFGNWFRKRCNEAGLPHCSAHGLRKAGATVAAEHGASDRELMALFGWETEKQAGVYTRKADRARLARHAAEKLEIGTSIPAPSDPVRPEDEIDQSKQA